MRTTDEDAAWAAASATGWHMVSDKDLDDARRRAYHEGWDDGQQALRAEELGKHAPREPEVMEQITALWVAIKWMAVAVGGFAAVALILDYVR